MHDVSAIVDEMIRHLPPSSHNLMLLDISSDDMFAAAVAARRKDVHIIRYGTEAQHHLHGDSNLPLASCSLDAVSALSPSIEDHTQWFKEVLRVLRPGGRFMMYINLTKTANMAAILADNGFARVLGEVIEKGTLIRGEKPYDADQTTVERTAQTSQSNKNTTIVLSMGRDYEQIRARFLYILIWQLPNKPVWRMTAADVITWSTPQIETFNGTQVLAFTSLPKAVAFMQRAVLADFINDINRIVKFEKTIVADWNQTILLNPDSSIMHNGQRISAQGFAVDPSQAEAADE